MFGAPSGPEFGVFGTAVFGAASGGASPAVEEEVAEEALLPLPVLFFGSTGASTLSHT